MNKPLNSTRSNHVLHPAHEVGCPYCGGQTEMVTGDRIYPHRRDLYSKHFYLCDLCNAYVGCHPGTCTPLGTPANGKTRKARSAAHYMFDDLWLSGRMSRTKAYTWLQEQLNLPQEACHIAMFNDAQCALVVQAVSKYLNKE